MRDETRERGHSTTFFWTRQKRESCHDGFTRDARDDDDDGGDDTQPLAFVSTLGSRRRRFHAFQPSFDLDSYYRGIVYVDSKFVLWFAVRESQERVVAVQPRRESEKNLAIVETPPGLVVFSF